jgi:hypothetical protein
LEEAKVHQGLQCQKKNKNNKKEKEKGNKKKIKKVYTK